MGREYELKYRADSARLAAIRAAYGPFEPISMETTYYDTPAGDLSRLRWTLRRRLENGTSVCTLKTPAPGGGRGEWETECGSIEDALWSLCKLGAPRELMVLTANGIAPSCGARFTRLAARLEIPGGIVELALDQGVLIGGGREQPLCEVEVEQKDGSEEAAAAFAAELAARFGLTPEHRSKVQRAQALAKSQ